MTIAVLDTNVLASGFIGENKPKSTPGELIRRWRAGSYILVVSDHILTELADTFTDSYFARRLSAVAIIAALESLRVDAAVHPITMTVVGIASHAEDDLVLATALGNGALVGNTTASDNTAIGNQALAAATTGASNTAVGAGSLASITGASGNTAVGFQALGANTTGGDNTALGFQALADITTAINNTAVGFSALLSTTTGIGNTAVGAGALAGTNFTNTAGLGVNSAVTGDSQVQLGNSATTTFAYGPVQNRSDLRDKSDVRDTQLGLAFVQALRPVDFRWDMREDYRPAPPDPPAAEANEAERKAYEGKLARWREAATFGNLAHDGTHKRTRFHHGLIAQEVADVIARAGVDFGGYQNHAVTGGDDVLSLGYDEFIAPLIKAVQELAEENAQIRARLAAVEAAREE